MLQAKLLYLKDKQAFTKENGLLRLLGKPIDIAKQWKKDGIGLLHIIDLDALKGLGTNFDVYDKLSYIMHVEVECGEHPTFIEKLLTINTRVVLSLPSKLDLEKFTDNRRSLVGKISPDFDGSTEQVHDLLIENATLQSVQKFAKSGKRVLIYKKDYTDEMKGYLFTVIEA